LQRDEKPRFGGVFLFMSGWKDKIKNMNAKVAMDAKDRKGSPVTKIP
jgi:hypothetical protein